MHMLLSINNLRRSLLRNVIVKKKTKQQFVSKSAPSIDQCTELYAH